MKNEDLQTAVTCGNIDSELLKITPIFLAVVEQSTVITSHQCQRQSPGFLTQDVGDRRMKKL